MLINDPATVAELRELYPRYEASLGHERRRDPDEHVLGLTLCGAFWPHRESVWHRARLKPFAKARSPANLARTITRLEIVTFGKDFASITVAFEREVEGQAHARPAEPDMGPPSRRMAHCLRPRVAPALRRLS